MKVVRFCGRSADDLYVLLSKDDWELGDPEGLARWTPSGWRWVYRIDLGYSQQIGYVKDDLVIMGIDGSLLFFADEKLVKREVGPGGITAQVGECFPSFYRFAATTSGEIVIVGNVGCLFLYNRTNWFRVETGITEKLKDILERNGSFTICGNKGTLLDLNGTECQRVECETSDDFLHCGQGDDGSVYCLAYSSRKFRFVRIEGSRISASYSLPHDVMAMLVQNAERIIYSTYDGVYFCDGTASTPMLPNTFVAQMEMIGSHIALALRGSSTSNPRIVFDPLQPLMIPGPNPRELAVTLSESFLD